MSIDTVALAKLLEAASPRPWVWVFTPSAHTLDSPRNAPDAEWDGVSELSAVDQLRSGGGDSVLYGVWCNDDTAEIGVRAPADACLIALAPTVAQAILDLYAALGELECDRGRQPYKSDCVSVASLTPCPVCRIRIIAGTRGDKWHRQLLALSDEPTKEA